MTACTVNVDSLKLRGEIALWRQKWILLKNESNFVPETAVAALEGCDQTTFIHTFLSILVTLPMSILPVLIEASSPYGE